MQPLSRGYTDVTGLDAMLLNAGSLGQIYKETLPATLQ